MPHRAPQPPPARASLVHPASDVFNVNLVLSGGVQRQGDLVRLAINLVDTKDLRQLRSKVIEGSESELASLEDRVAEAMAEMLDL